jgi:hypothetical protein
MVQVMPFGNYYGQSMNVKVNCSECYVPLVVAPMMERMEDQVAEAVHEHWDEETMVDGNW